MNLIKEYHCPAHDLFKAKLSAYGFGKKMLTVDR